VQHGRDWVDYLTLLFTLLGVAVVALYTHYTKKLVELTSASLEAARESGAEALAETRRSNETTEESNRIAGESFELGTRAWLSVSFKPILDRGNFIGYSFELTNLGKIPALNVEVLCSFDVWESDTEVPDEIPSDNSRRLEMGLAIGPGMTHVSIPPAESYRNLSAIQLTTCYCRVTYKDFFNTPRLTEACWRYRPQISIPDRRDWLYASKHNHMK